MPASKVAVAKPLANPSVKGGPATERRKGGPHRFAPGNTHSVGNPGPSRSKAITSVIIAKLNEVNKDDPKRREHIYALVDELFDLALGYHTVNRKRVKGAGDLSAIVHIIDRAEGKIPTTIQGDEEGGGVTIIFGPRQEKL